MAEAQSLQAAGHDLIGVAAEGTSPWISSPAEPGLTDRLLRRSTLDRIEKLTRKTHADIYRPVHLSALPAAESAAQSQSRSSVLVNPGWERPTSGDLIALAPTEPWRSVPASGLQAGLHVPGWSHDRRSKAEGSVLVAYRKTQRNPGRYLETALRRIGLEVTHVESVDWTSIPPETKALILVESPLPALPVHGRNPGVPVIFWVHHGEHHVDANTRLQRHYRAHAVVMAHSWHLAHRFIGLVDRLPFAAAPELFSRAFRPHGERDWLVGFVGATSPDTRYERRDQLLQELKKRLGPDRVTMQSGLAPEAMADLYENSRVVVDDGAGRHLPITMRVFEATAAGALLVTNAGPGLDILLTRGSEFVELPRDVARLVDIVLSDTEPVARSGYDETWFRHTYDDRARDVLDVAERVKELGIEEPEPVVEERGLASVIGRFPDAQRVLDLGGSMRGFLPGREVWDYERFADRAEPATFHASVIAESDPEATRRAIAAARTAVVTPKSLADSVAIDLMAIHSDATRHDFDEETVFTFGSSGYRVSPAPDLDS